MKNIQPLEVMPILGSAPCSPTFEKVKFSGNGWKVDILTIRASDPESDLTFRLGFGFRDSLATEDAARHRGSNHNEHEHPRFGAHEWAVLPITDYLTSGGLKSVRPLLSPWK